MFWQTVVDMKIGAGRCSKVCGPERERGADCWRHRGFDAQDVEWGTWPGWGVVWNGVLWCILGDIFVKRCLRDIAIITPCLQAKAICW